MRNWLTIWLLLLSPYLNAQLAGENDAPEEERLEAAAEASDADVSDDDYTEQMLRYRTHPLDLNAPESTLGSCPLLEPLLIANLVEYRRLLGNLISVYELQAVPGFTVDIIQRIRPYVTVAPDEQGLADVLARLKGGDRYLLVRPSLTPERSKGFRAATPAQRFHGAPEKLLVRYRYNYRNLLQYGILADQDAGERFSFQRQAGFDFYSFHVVAHQRGWLRTVILGDYSVNLGQGLCQWQSLAFSKTPAVMSIKRQAETIRPYFSAGEYNFFRGVAATARWHRLEVTGFASSRKLTANTAVDSALGAVITSLQTSGMHRTQAEIDDRNDVSLTAAGGSISWNADRWHVGVNAVGYHYSLPLSKRREPYTLFSIRGRDWQNLSADYSFTWHNLHGFGELAVDRRYDRASVAGLMMSMHRNLDLALLFRSIDRKYQSVYGNAFTESTLPTDENGMYMGCSVRPATAWKLDLFADLFRFSWLRYRTDAPVSGVQYFVQATWQPRKQLQVYSRVRLKRKPLNDTEGDELLSSPEDVVTKNWRTQMVLVLNRSVTLRGRVEASWYVPPGRTMAEKGLLLYGDLLYKPIGTPVHFNTRLQMFRTDGYNARIYAYENDVLFGSSTPAFFNRGLRAYVNAVMHIRSRLLAPYQLQISMKIARTLYEGVSSIGSGVDAIAGNHRSDVRLQLFFSSG